MWHAAGFLQTTPGQTIEYEYVADWLYERFTEWNIGAVGFDRWNMKHLRPWLKKAGFKDKDIEGAASKFIEFGQGTQSMSPALRTLEAIVTAKQMQHGNHPVLTMCMGNARVSSPDPSNRKLDKVRSKGRIDGAVALAMAVGVASEHTAKPPKDYAIKIL
jgi:phage terminase large subunit-like protein